MNSLFKMGIWVFPVPSYIWYNVSANDLTIKSRANPAGCMELGLIINTRLTLHGPFDYGEQHGSMSLNE